MVQLKILVVSSISEEEILDLQSISSPLQFLEHIFLRGRLKKLPNCILGLHNLVTLGLCFSFLVEDPLVCVKLCLI
jgi:disease resistance protein RPM1